MQNHFIRILILLFIFNIGESKAQETYTVRDGFSKESIPFVKIFPQNDQPFLADIDGKFTWKEEWATVRLSYSGYLDTSYILANQTSKDLAMSLRTQELQEMVAVAGENPAHRIMDLVIANRKKNNPLDNDAFRYNSYTKFVTEIDENIIAAISDTTTDSSKIFIRDFINKSHLFLIESSSIRTFVPPSRDKEEVIAYKASGLSDPMFATIAKELQSFSFYENQFAINGKTYINPIALGGTRRYLFVLEDTTLVGVDTVFHIRYRPRKGKNFDGLQGMLYINTNGYAIEKVYAEPYDKDITGEVKIIQEYSFLEGKKWFPTKLSSELVFPLATVMIGDSVLVITSKSSTYIDQVQLNPEKVKRLYFDNASVIINEGADKVEEEQWRELRKYQLSEKEQNTYPFIDSLVKESNLDKLFEASKVLATGKIPVKYINIDLNKLLIYNQHEGVRLGLGVETSQKLIKPLTVGAYFAYGFRDKKFKHGGFVDLRLYRPKDFKLSITYEDDVTERGGRPYLNEMISFTSPVRLRSIYITNMDRRRKAEAQLSAYVTANFRLGLFTNYQRVNFLNGYGFNNGGFAFENGALGPLSLSSIDAFETGATILWTIRDKVMIVGDKRVSLGSKFPTIYLRAAKSTAGVFESNLDYYRFYSEISQTISIRGIGKFVYSLSAGKTIGEVPLTFAHNTFNSMSSNFKLNISVPNTFETMFANNIYLSDQVGLFTRFNFNTIKSWSKKFQPQVSLHHAVGFGLKVNNTPHLGLTEIRGMEKGYYEAGILFNNLLLKNFGVGTFYNYGAYSNPDAIKNLFVKLTMKVGFN